MFTKEKFLHLAVIEGVSVVAVARVLLVAVEAVIIWTVQEVGSRGGQALDGIGVVLILGLVVLQEEEEAAEGLLGPVWQRGRRRWPGGEGA